MSAPVLTVIVPTRNRADTLVHCLRTVVAQENPDIEILVSDNFSGPEVKDVVAAIADTRLRYVRTDKTLGMSEHWDFALSHAKGEWVTIVGDDDGLVPGAVDKFLALARQHPDIRAITCANSWYRWPAGEMKNGRLSIIGSHGYEIRDCLEYMKKALLGEPVSQPTIYTGGFVRRDLIEEIRQKSGGIFFKAMNPDYYSGMAICSMGGRYIYSWEPWCIAGSSKHSNGFQHKNKTKEEIKAMGFYTQNALGFHPSLGTASDAGVGSSVIYLYESFLQSRHLRQDDLGITMADVLEVSILHAGPRIRKNVIDYCRKVAESNHLPFAPIMRAAELRRPAYKLKKLSRKVLRRIPGMSKLPEKNIADPNLKNVYDAAEKIGKLLAT